MNDLKSLLVCLILSMLVLPASAHSQSSDLSPSTFYPELFEPVESRGFVLGQPGVLR